MDVSNGNQSIESSLDINRLIVVIFFSNVEAGIRWNFGAFLVLLPQLVPHLSLHVETVNRFNRPVVFIHASRADCRFILACCVHSLCIFLKLFR